MAFTEGELERITLWLKDKATLPCPRCNGRNFTVAKGYFSHPIQPGLGGLTLGGEVIPTVPVICTTCGFLCEYAAGVVGLLDPSRLEAKQNEPA
jgi:hypothetical protein